MCVVVFRDAAASPSRFAPTHFHISISSHIAGNLDCTRYIKETADANLTLKYLVASFLFLSVCVFCGQIQRLVELGSFSLSLGNSSNYCGGLVPDSERCLAVAPSDKSMWTVRVWKLTHSRSANVKLVLPNRLWGEKHRKNIIDTPLVSGRSFAPTRNP